MSKRMDTITWVNGGVDNRISIFDSIEDCRTYKKFETPLYSEYFCVQFKDGTCAKYQLEQNDGALQQFFDEVQTYHNLQKPIGKLIKSFTGTNSNYPIDVYYDETVNGLDYWSNVNNVYQRIFNNCLNSYNIIEDCKNIEDSIYEDLNSKLICLHCCKDTGLSKILYMSVEEDIKCPHCGNIIIYANKVKY